MSESLNIYIGREFGEMTLNIASIDIAEILSLAYEWNSSRRRWRVEARWGEAGEASIMINDIENLFTDSSSLAEMICIIWATIDVSLYPLRELAT